MKTAVVILHYENQEVTRRCVALLLEHTATDIPIVIVDNGSPNGSGRELRREYGETARIHVLQTGKNLGFAAGNNVGYDYARREIGAESIVVMNTDAFIEDAGFVGAMQTFMAERDVDIAGPDIETPEGRHQNPLMRRRIGTLRLTKIAMIDAVRLIMLRTGLFRQKILDTYTSSGNALHRDEMAGDILDCVPHGACIVFGPRYVVAEEMAFRPGTFLYCEEYMLYDYAAYRGYKTGVTTRAKVLHLGGVSTLPGSVGAERQIQKSRHMLQSEMAVLRNRLRYYVAEKTGEKAKM